MKDVSLEDFSRLVSDIYAAAVKPRHWEPTLDAITRRFGGTGAALVIPNNDPWYLSTLPAEANEAYRMHYHRLDRVAATAARGPVGVVRTGTELMPLVRRTEFSDWLRPHDIDDALIVRLDGGQPPACLILAAPRRTEPFDAPERVTLMNGLIPHLRQALLAHDRLAEVDRSRHELAAVLETVRHGVVIVDRNQLVINLNSAAEDVLRAEDGLQMQSGHVVASCSPADRRLRHALNGALGADASTVGGGRTVVCERPSGKASFLVQVLPLRHPATAEVPTRATALVLINDPDEEPGPEAELLRRAFGLTGSETVVAMRIAQGAELKEICGELSVSITTVRKHLQHVFDKTDTHRQADLVRLLFTLTHTPTLVEDPNAGPP